MRIVPTVQDYSKAAKKIWEWATGFDFESQTTPVPTPADAEIRGILAAEGVTVPPGVQFKIVRDDQQTFHIVLRDQETMRASLSALRSDQGTYEFPDDLRTAYVEFFTDANQYDGPSQQAKDNRVDLVSARLGDYTFSTCAS